MKKLYRKNDSNRLKPLLPHVLYGQDNSRTEYRRDYARVLHSPAFRRLQGKTQLFPGLESDFFRNRLTHSLEVAQVAKDIAIYLNSTSPPMNKHIGKPTEKDYCINLDIVELAGLIHDLGHPPFGHNGEKALNDKMQSRGGFEGNAQTIRIITRLEKKEPCKIEEDCDPRTGLNLTVRSIAAALKYDRAIPQELHPKDGKIPLVKGYYRSEKNIIDNVKWSIIGEKRNIPKKFKTVECQIMDIADDISYSVFDLEDSLKAGFLTPLSILSNVTNQTLIAEVKNKVQRTIPHITDNIVMDTLLDLFTPMFSDQFDYDDSLEPREQAFENSIQINLESERISKNGYYRTLVTSDLIKDFIHGIVFKYNTSFPALSSVSLNKETLLKVEVLKQYNYVATIMSSRLKVAEYRGYQIVSDLFDKLIKPEGSLLLPEDYRELYNEHEDKSRVVCDFIAGMTDNYAVEFYCRLNSANPQSIFKPF